MSENNKKIIVLTGGPGTGKTTIINAMAKQGFCCYPEISREIISQAKKQGIDQLFLENPLLFSEMLLERRKKQFLEATLEKERVIFLDRGLPDVLAYMQYIGNSYPKKFTNLCKTYQYYKVFLFPPWDEIYENDNERYENFEESKLIYDHLKETYLEYGYDVVEIPKDSIENRILFILEEISV